MPVAVQVREILRYAGGDVRPIGALPGHHGGVIDRTAIGEGRMIRPTP